MKRLVEDYKLTEVYPEDVFYKTHKITRKDFLNKLDKASSNEEREKLILSLYDDDMTRGRRGVLSLKEALKLTDRKVEDREKFTKFAEKYGKHYAQELKVPGTSYSSFKDLI